MSEQVAIIGAGGHGREVLQACVAAQRSGMDVEFVGFFDDHPDHDLLQRLDAPWIGGIADARHFAGGCWLGLGSGELKARFAQGINDAPPLVHPLADVGMDVELRPGSVVFAQATVTTNIVVGRHAHVGRGAAIGHDSSIGDFASIMPLVSVSGNVSVGEGCFVGTGALVRQGVSLGRGSTVGMGAVVLKDVEPGATVMGNPARVRG